MHKIIILLFVSVLFPFLVSTPVHALKKRVTVTKSTPAGIGYSSVKLNRASHSTVISFMNLDKVSKIEYELGYLANGISQGAIGSITPTSTTDTRDLYFGTCSKGVCTPHSRITGATLILRFSLKSGSVLTKRYRIKI